MLLWGNHQQRRSWQSSDCPFPGCQATAVTDLLFLVDGSSSVGRSNFKHIRNFISATVTAFQISEERTRVGVVQYSDTPRTEFNLNEHLTRPALLKAIGSLPYNGGNTRTGETGTLFSGAFGGTLYLMITAQQLLIPHKVLLDNNSLKKTCKFPTVIQQISFGFWACYWKII